MKLAADCKWRRLRRWVNAMERKERAFVLEANPGFVTEYHARRHDVFKAVQLVMDAENRRARKKRTRLNAIVSAYAVEMQIGGESP